MKKTKLLTLIILLFSLYACSSGVLSGSVSPGLGASGDLYDSISDTVVSLQINDPIMQINGSETEIDAGRGTKPIITNGRTLVPIRAIIEALGGSADWEENTQSILLTMEDDTIKMTAGSTGAYLNGKAETLDAAPAVINGRTMLPIRFIAESFNLGVAWDSSTQTVYIIKDTFDDSEYNALMSVLPGYSGQAYTQINGNKPFFKDYDIIKSSFEYYSSLDSLGRCDVCMASIAADLMPAEERESISSVTPASWLNVRYDNVDGGYLYNRCHLIGFQLTGENANERNLITGTRYLNINGMLPFENQIANYIESTGNRVIYRSTPVFTGNNLVADGVLLEAYSVEDNGQGITFCVYCYNVQPDINIDYTTGASYAEGKAKTIPETSPSPEVKSTPEVKRQTPPKEDKTGKAAPYAVYRTPSGKKYHFSAECGGKNSYKVSLNDAKRAGLTPCSKCAG